MLKINYAADEIIRHLQLSGLTTYEAIEAIGLSLSCMINHTAKDSDDKINRLNDLVTRISETFSYDQNQDLNGL